MIKRTIHGLSIKDWMASVLLQGRGPHESTRRDTPVASGGPAEDGAARCLADRRPHISLGYGLAADLAGVSRQVDARGRRLCEQIAPGDVVVTADGHAGQ
jgi:hypothetical protein